MPFTVEEFRDLVRILEERPEWRGELRRLVLTDELLSLPEQVASLRATTEGRFQELTRQVAELAEAQKRTEGHITDLAEAQKRTEGQVTELAESVRILADGMGELKGEALESRYRAKGLAYFSRMIRRAYVLSSDELSILVEKAVDSGVLSDDQAQEIYEADLIVRGKRREDGAEVYLVVEVSWGVGTNDVERAARRASLFAHTGATAIPVVAGKWVTPEAGGLARKSQTWQLTNGRVIPPEPAAALS
jgi:hypothetical protein